MNEKKRHSRSTPVFYFQLAEASTAAPAAPAMAMAAQPAAAVPAQLSPQTGPQQIMVWQPNEFEELYSVFTAEMRQM